MRMRRDLDERDPFPVTKRYTCIKMWLGLCIWEARWLIVSALVSRLISPVSSPGYGQCFVLLGKTLYSHRASLRPDV